jgi:hypothetical protein
VRFSQLPFTIEQKNLTKMSGCFLLTGEKDGTSGRTTYIKATILDFANDL